MAEPLVPDELGEAIAPLLPRHKARPGRRGRPPVEDRAGRTGMVFVLRRGIPWEMLPQERGCGSGVTCGRRLRSWQRRGVCKKLRHALRQRVGQERGSDGQHGGVDSPSFRAVLGGPAPAKPHGSGQKRHPTARARRWQGYPAGPAPHRSEPHGVARGDELGGRQPAPPRAARPAAAAAQGVGRGSPVGQAAQSTGPQGAGDRGSPGAAADAARQRPGQSPRGGGEHALLGRPGPAPADPVRQAAGDASGFPLPSPRPDLLQGAPEGFLK